MTYSLKTFVAGIVALVGAFLVMFVFPNFDYNGIIGIVATILGFLGVVDFRKQFDAAVAFFRTKTMAGALLTAVPMVIFALSRFFDFNLPSFVVEGLKYLVEIGGGWTLMGTAHALSKTTNK